MKTLVAICIGASAGALMRWWLGLALNHYYPALPPGTVAANLIGAFVIGIALVVFSSSADIAPEWRVFIITGFCGGLTTFSTFSAEIVVLLQQGRAIAAAGAVAIHVAGSVLMTFAGIACAVSLRRWLSA